MMMLQQIMSRRVFLRLFTLAAIGNLINHPALSPINQALAYSDNETGYGLGEYGAGEYPAQSQIYLPFVAGKDN